jgi:hypothetical protein
LLPFHPEITSEDIEDTILLDPGRKVIFQHKGNFYVLDPGKECSAPSPGKEFLKDRCFAIYSILADTISEMDDTLPGFEFVYEFEDFPLYRANNHTMKHKPMPGFGAVRCWQKGFMSFPMFGSHARWDIKSIDAKIAGITGRRPTPFDDRKGAAVFRGGGMRTCSFPPEQNGMLVWQLPGFNNYYKGAPCGRHKLEVIGLERPDLVDFGDTERGAGRLSMTEQEDLFKYIISAEGHGGWADRLYELLLYDVGLIVQEHPCKEWNEEMFFPFQHYIPVANDFSNLLGRIQWAERHPHAVQDMIRSRLVQAKHVLSRKGITTFSAVMWTLYAELQRYPIGRRDGAVALADIFP